MAVRWDEEADSYICDQHGELDYTGWLPCWSCGGEGGQDEHEYDPVNYAPDEEWDTCCECKGLGGWHVCPQCCNDPDVEW